VDDEIVGEFDDPPEEIEEKRERECVDVIDVEIEAIDPDGYTDQIMNPARTTPGHDDSSASGPYSPDVRPLGLTGPAGSGLMRLEDAVEAQAAMREREAARIRDMRRR
jgi:hypothetical protein